MRDGIKNVVDQVMPLGEFRSDIEMKYDTLHGEIKSQIEVINSRLKAHAKRYKGKEEKTWGWPRDLEKVLKSLKDASKLLG